jgi:hypothetical protein
MSENEIAQRKTVPPPLRERERERERAFLLSFFSPPLKGKRTLMASVVPGSSSNRYSDSGSRTHSRMLPEWYSAICTGGDTGAIQ